LLRRGIDAREKIRELCKLCRRNALLQPVSGEPFMSIRSVSFRSALMLAGAVALMGMGSARAEESVMKQCADKWQAAKAANTTGGMSYLQFSSKCRADLKSAPAAAPAAAAPAPAPAAAPAPVAPAAAPAAPVAPAKPRVAAPAPAPAAPAAAGSAVFPTAISPAHASESAGKARMHTCVDQYNANKATNANGGLKWIQKGGGYYSECNAKLKG
jgi:hypothetical protein